ncbi:hypothetical protein BASA50_002415 [Batrachochytrium salamandrivorans]|uniref:Uncharacterized protein n=1 Tax=Batrachochytrium salamandrivorans TaxID=1357716 RepID=A0ABQ8FLL4_9FUNG|nr:hypothetical protein BASA50_002415 [Batrachochytrium salamandrivorans]KAH9249322.1 hypothetical protein BASA81_012940 [Batrachochytrium salamandrivorans]
MDYKKGDIQRKKWLQKQNSFDGRSPIQALYDKIRAGDFIFNVMVDSKCHLSSLPSHQVVVTDRKLALVAALDIVFPFEKNLLLRMACQQQYSGECNQDICKTFATRTTI